MKSKKRRYIPFEERAIVPNTHEAIIPQDRWENVQRILYSRSGCFMCDKTDYDNIFKGIIRCADCGRTMLVKVEHRRKRNSVLDQTFYCCSTYRKYGAKACDSHNLEARVLHEAVFADIQAHAKAAVSNREALVKKIANQMHLRVSSDRAQHKRDLKQCKARIAEIEDLYAKLYEDVSKGLLPEKRFQMLADRYDKEQAELTEKIEQYEREGRAEHDQLDKIQDFIDEVSKYAGITELNYKILHQLIDKILVSKAEKVDGEYVQKIQIFTAQQTLDYAQSLYEKRLITYPRTDSRFLTEDMAASLPGLATAVGKAFAVEEPFSIHVQQVINGSKVTDHHALLPTKSMANADLAALPAGERNVLRLIAARLLCAVGEPHCYAETTLTTICAGEEFSAKGKVVLSEGWKAMERKMLGELLGKQKESAVLPDVQEQSQCSVTSAELKEGQTSPPKSYTEDTLLSAMQAAGADSMPEGGGASGHRYSGNQSCHH